MTINEHRKIMEIYILAIYKENCQTQPAGFNHKDVIDNKAQKITKHRKHSSNAILTSTSIHMESFRPHHNMYPVRLFTGIRWWVWATKDWYNSSMNDSLSCVSEGTWIIVETLLSKTKLRRDWHDAERKCVLFNCSNIKASSYYWLSNQYLAYSVTFPFLLSPLCSNVSWLLCDICSGK